MYAVFSLVLFSSLSITASSAAIQKPLGDYNAVGAEDALASLNRTLGSRIKVMKPKGKPCYSMDGSSGPLDETKCKIVMRNKEGDVFMSDQPGGY